MILSRIGWGQEKDSESLNLCNPKKIITPRFQRMMLEGLRGMEIWHSMMDGDSRTQTLNMWMSGMHGLSTSTLWVHCRNRSEQSLMLLFPPRRKRRTGKSSLATFDDEERNVLEQSINGFQACECAMPYCLHEKNKSALKIRSTKPSAWMRPSATTMPEFRKRQRGILERVTENWEGARYHIG